MNFYLSAKLRKKNHKQPLSHEKLMTIIKKYQNLTLFYKNERFRFV